jgi:drug/metabolite transporter (DMT)-like permease
MNPIVAMIVGSLIVGEKLTLAIIGGSLVTLIGVYLVNQSLKKQREDVGMPDADGI